MCRPHQSLVSEVTVLDGSWSKRWVDVTCWVVASTMLTPGRSAPRPSWLTRTETEPELLVCLTKPQADCPIKPLAVVMVVPLPVEASQTNTPEGVAM